MKIYQLNYSTEDCNRDYGFFTTKEKAEKAKKEIVKKSDEDMQDYLEREIYIYEIELDKIIK
jgi:hypothetical protein